MAELLQFICENSDSFRILAVLKRFVERKDLTVDLNFLESLKLVLLELEKSKNLTEELAGKILREICWPTVYGSSFDNDSQLSGNNRKKLHLCYDIVAFCCSVFPTTLLSEIYEKSLQVLRRYVGEMIATEENAHDASVTLDLIGNLVKSDALNASESTNVVSGEIGDKLFYELLNILPQTTESLCGKLTGLVLPKFLECKRTERCEAVWNVVKQISTSQAAGSATEFFSQTYTILCGLADFFFGPDNHNLFLQAEFWEIIQQGLVLNEPLTRKRSLYLLKRALDLLDKQPCDLLVLSEKGSHIFYWSCDKKDSLMNIWHDYVLLMETLDEKQAHLIKPVLQRISNIVRATKKSINGETMLDISWLFTLYHRASQHDTRFISRWAILDLLNMDLCDSPLLNTCYWRFLYGPLMSMLCEYNIYGRADAGLRGDPPPVGAAVLRFFSEFSKNLPSDNDRRSFCTGLLASIVKQNFSQVPLVFMLQMLASLPPCKAWDSKAIGSISEIFPLLRTFNPHLSASIQSFLLKAVINLTDSGRVAWRDIGVVFSLLSEDDCLCRGNVLWEATVQWVCQIHGTVGQEDCGKAGLNPAETGFSDLFEHLRSRVEVFVNDDTLELSTGDPEVESVVRLAIIACDASFRCSKNSGSRLLTEGLFRQIVEIIQHASGHVYASEGRTERAARILSGILHHLNSTTANQGSSRGKWDSSATATQSIDSSMGIMEELLKTSGVDILELLLRKLSTASSNFSPVDRSSAFLDLARELFTFMVVTVSSVQGLEVYFHFIENLVQRSRTTVLDKQSDRQKLTVSDWSSFVLAMKCLAWCSTALRVKRSLHITHLVQALAQTVAEFDLSSEFPKPRFLYQGQDREDTSAETSLFLKKGWGRLVSDFIEAQWRCVEFLLEQGYSDSGDTQLKDKLEPFLENLPDAAFEALSMGSGLAVVPVIRCVRLLTPRMLLTDDVLCSQALESVWWTFQDRQKGDHVWFWGTLREMTKVLFNPCLLVLPVEHPITAIVRRYWGELLTLGEDRPGIVNHVIGPSCEFWANCQNNDPNLAREISEEDRKRSLDVHLDFLTEACVFGPRVKKTMRVTCYVLEYVRMLGEEREISPLCMDEMRDDTRVRVNGINMLLMLNPENERDARLLQRVVRVLIAKLDELTEEKPRSSINSYSHRRKHRVWQAILVALSQLFKADTEVTFAGEVLEESFRASLSENQVSVRNFIQWGMVLILQRYPSLQPLLWKQLIYDPDRRSGSVLSLITVAALVGEFSFSDSRSQAAYFQQAFHDILPWVLTPHVVVQAYAQVALQKMWLTCQRRNLHDVISNHSIIQSCVYFLETSKDGMRQKTRLLGDYFFLDCHPFRDFSVQTLFETLPRLAEVTDEEWISPKFFSLGSLGMHVWESSGIDVHGLPLYSPKDTRLAQILNGVYVNCDESIGEQISRRLTGQALNRSNTVQSSELVDETNLSKPQSQDVQKKIMPWKVIPPDEEIMSEIQEQRMANLQKSSSGNLIVVASLIDKAPNLGGLCRTCEIFGVQTLVLSNSHVIEDVQFKSLSVSAAKWMNLEEVRMSELKSYLGNMRHEGYTLVGVEQTANSVNLTQYQFPHKSLLLLGNEKEGIPVELIQMLDVCVEIPQVGVIRSLNVHVSGALLVWEYTRQRVLTGTF